MGGGGAGANNAKTAARLLALTKQSIAGGESDGDGGTGLTRCSTGGKAGGGSSGPREESARVVAP